MQKMMRWIRSDSDINKNKQTPRIWMLAVLAICLTFVVAACDAGSFAVLDADDDAQLMRASGNRFSLPILLLGLPIVALTSTGAKSGKARTMPVIGVPDGRNIALVASSWGQEKNPAWYYNLRANPVAELRFGGQTTTYTVREVTEPEEYRRLWQQANEVYLAFDKYQQRAADRKIPIMLLEPRV